MLWIKEICIQQCCHDKKFLHYQLCFTLYILCAKFYLISASNDGAIAFTWLTCKQYDVTNSLSFVSLILTNSDPSNFGTRQDIEKQ